MEFQRIYIPVFNLNTKFEISLKDLEDSSAIDISVSCFCTLQTELLNSNSKRPLQILWNLYCKDFFICIFPSSHNRLNIMNFKLYFAV